MNTPTQRQPNLQKIADLEEEIERLKCANGLLGITIEEDRKLLARAANSLNSASFDECGYLHDPDRNELAEELREAANE